MVYKRNQKKSTGRKVRYSRTKKMVTGHGPTMLESIASGVGSVAKLAMAVAPAIAAINTESKYYDQVSTLTSYSPGTNDSLINLTQAIAQGLDDTNRIGNSILAQDLQLRLAHSFTQTAGAPNVNSIFCRMMLICWKENLQANAPTIAKIFESPNNIYSLINKDNSDQFVIMKDKFFCLNAQSGLPGSQAFQTAKLYKKLNWHLRFNGTGTAAGTQNHVYLLLRSSATGAATALNTTYISRLNYTDN